MAQQINDNFSILAGIPLDDRNTKTTIGLRDAIPITLRYDGLLCYVSQVSTLYQLQGGVENANWVGIAGSNVSSDFETEIEGFLALSAGKTILNAWEVEDKFRGWIGTRYVVGSIVSLPVSLPSDIDNPAKVSLAVDSNNVSPVFPANYEVIADGLTDTFAKGTTALAKMVFFGGVPLRASDWSNSGTDIVLTFIPDAGTPIQAV